ncbi:hypothetical protein BJF89_11965 [Corynebacterium sp. CNJ-954]|uniref:hypothetical protein n=1 Tax=Corynebacterium sp. CNJ-954 TaxID=1904962 RepID=UPI00095CF00D|nr:hypothetical protein [Corynebacterium sp. CNJ-954]OLT56139.1 hypothetical protein BJF89_11965 [Corynebacterium sp. CNJ-954]
MDIIWNTYVMALENFNNGALDFMNFTGIRPVYNAVFDFIYPANGAAFDDNGYLDLSPLLR